MAILLTGLDWTGLDDDTDAFFAFLLACSEGESKHV